ncbi:cytochrome o ubiquinol oxidase subunit IV [Sphingopyxis sp. LARHCG72]
MTESEASAMKNSLPGEDKVHQGSARHYVVGLLLALALTATSFWVASTDTLWAPGVPIGLAVLAVAQMGVHLVFFLHMTTSPDNTNNILALAFGLVIMFLVVVGSLWIMANLDANMVHDPNAMNIHTQR